ncbi:hypothetical protein ACOMHN_040192 [Nucella lapillus]
MAKLGILLVFWAAFVYVGGVELKGGQLRADQEPEAWWDSESKQWFIRLTCGAFTFEGAPPLNVTWTTPHGEAKFSSGYDDESGRFYLSLDSPVQGGNYTCALPRQHLPAGCDEDEEENPDEISASVEVDEMKARLTLAAANQNTLLEMVEDLKEWHSQDLQNLTEFCHDIENKVDEQDAIIQGLESSAEGNVSLSLNNSGNVPQNNSGNVPQNNSVELEGVCREGGYVALDDAWRWRNNSDDGETFCDDDLDPAWYRFLLHGQPAVIPVDCVPTNHCHTHAPFWLDLQGETMPEMVNEQTEARACAHWSDDCCNWESPITVRNCGDFFIYKIQPISTCRLAYCTEPQA